MATSNAKKWCIRLGLLVGTPVLLVGSLELVLGLTGVRVPKYVGPQSGLETYWVPCRDPKSTPGYDYAIPTEREFVKHPSPIFVKDKPKNGYRVFVLGESTVVGAPYETGVFVDWLRIRMTAMMPDRFVEVVNAGNGGWFSDWISILADECLDYSPDLMIWLAGHNEFHPWHLDRIREDDRNPAKAVALRFAQSLRTFWALSRLWPASARPHFESVDRNLTPERDCYRNELPSLQRDYRENLTRVVRNTKRAGVPLVVCTLPRNVRTFPPRTSPFSVKTSPGSPARARWEYSFTAGTKHVAEGNAEAALAAFADARSIDDRPAKLYFWTGKALELAQRTEEARRAYLDAIERDGCPSRAQEWVQSFVRETAAKERLPLVDLEKSFDKRGVNNLSGDELIYDNLHPNFMGHELIAAEILTVLEKDMAIPFDHSRDVPRDLARRSMGLDEYDGIRGLHAECLANAKVVLETAQSTEFTTRVRDQCKKLLEKAPDDAFVRFHLGLIEALAGDADQGHVNAERAIRESRRVRYKAVLASRNEPPYARAIKAARVDLVEAEKGLTAWERDTLRLETRH